MTVKFITAGGKCADGSRAVRFRFQRTGRLYGLAVLLFLAGCAARPELTVELQWPESEAPLLEGRGRLVRIVPPFADRRDMPETCGMQKSQGMDVGTVVCKGSPATQMAELLRRQLAADGFTVAVGDAKGAPKELRISGELLNLYAEPLGAGENVETDLQVRLHARSEEGLSAHRDFFVKGRGGSFQRSVNNAMRKILENMRAAIVDLVDRFGTQPQSAEAGKARRYQEGTR